MNGHAVVIVGGGPTGLMLAGESALAGVDVAIVERRASQEIDGARAGGLHSRTIEVLDEQAPAYACDVARAAQRRPALLTILTRRRRRVAAQATFLTDLAAQDHRARWRSPQAARAATQLPGRDGRASHFSTRLSMQRTYYARVGALLPQSGVQGRTFSRGR
jgi:predicted dinucleotide-binding enzyme